MKLNTKIVIIVLEISLVPLIFASLISYLSERSQFKWHIFSELDAIAKIQKDRIQLVMDDSLEQLTMFTSRADLLSSFRDFNLRHNPGPQKNINDILLETKTSVRSIHDISLALPAGLIVASTDASLIGVDVSAEEYFKQGIKQNNVSILRKDKSGTLVQYLAGPLILNGEILGAAILATDAADINNIVNDYTGLGNTGETLLVKNDGNGNALFLTNIRFDRSAALARLVGKEQVRVPSVHAVAGEETILSDAVDYRNVPVIAATRFLPGINWAIVVKIDQMEAFAPVKQLWELFLLLLIISAPLLIFISVSAARFIVAPIRKLVIGAGRIASGNFDYRIDVESHDEVGLLARSFNDMTSKLREYYTKLEAKVAERTAALEEKTNEAEANQKAIINIAADLQAAKALSDQKADELQKFNSAVENASDHIIITDSEGVILYANAAAEKITGYSRTEMVGKRPSLWGNQMGKEFYDKMWKTIKIDKQPFSSEITNLRKNGVLYLASASVAPILDSNGNVKFFVGIERDVTKERSIDRAKTEFVSLASHQLRTPLATTNWYAEMLMENSKGKLTVTQEKYLKEIYKSNQRMIKLVNGLLNISRIELGTFMQEPAVGDLMEAIETIISELASQIKIKKIKLHKEFDERVVSEEADVNSIRVIIQNLLSNAIKYNRIGGEVSLSLKLSGDSLIFTVSDNGYGIPSEERSRIFERFFRASNATDKDTDGTGLGLYMVKILLDKLGGKISFTSEENKGTTFTVSLPRLKAGENQPRVGP